MSSQEKIEMIERYLANDMSEEERRGFEAEVGQDSDLASELERRQTAHKALDFLISEDLRSELKAMEAKEGKVVTMKTKRTSYIYKMAIAASFLILIAAFFIFGPGGQMSGSQAALAYYESPDYSMRGSTNQVVELTSGLTALSNGDFEEAISQLSSITSDAEQYISATYYLAHAYFQNEQYGQAQERFEIVANSGDIRFLESAEWNLVLSCLAQENSNCEQEIEKITSNPGHPYHQNTLMVVDELK